MRIRPVFAWYDGYIGYYWSRKTRTLYLMVPMIGVAIELDALIEKNTSCGCEAEHLGPNGYGCKFNESGVGAKDNNDA
jgi:hypothetical protein